MIPTTFLSRMGTYDVEIQGATLKVRVVGHVDLVKEGLSELISQIDNTTVVGLVAKNNLNTNKARMSQLCLGGFNLNKSKARILQLCAGSRCLVIQLCHLEYIPQCLQDFLAHQEIFFVGVGLNRALSLLKYYYYGQETISGIEVGDLAARVLKKPNLRKKAVSAIAAEVGLPLEGPAASEVSVNLTASVFSHEEIKCVVQDVYATYLIGSKLVGSL